MDSQLFLMINVICVVLFSAWFLMGRKSGKSPTPLVFNQQGDSRTKKGFSESMMMVKSSDSTGLPNDKKMPDSPVEKNENQEKVLNVFFMYNGHDWDAYKVLGIPAGSNLRSVTEAFQETIRKVDPDTVPFLESAYQAILNHLNAKKKG